MHPEMGIIPDLQMILGFHPSHDLISICTNGPQTGNQGKEVCTCI